METPMPYIRMELINILKSLSKVQGYCKHTQLFKAFRIRSMELNIKTNHTKYLVNNNITLDQALFSISFNSNPLVNN